MNAAASEASPEKLGSLILEVFRLNAKLLASGDELVAEFGLTSARWQVLGAVARAPGGDTVARLARSLGLQRQGVRRIVSELALEGFVALRENRHHKRAALVVMTGKGRDAYAAAMRKREPWIRSLAAGLSADDIAGTTAVLVQLGARLDGTSSR